MALKWPGGLITKTKVTPAGPLEGGAASGVWTLAEALQWTGKELWPIAGNTFTPVIFIGGVETVGGSGVIVYTISQVNPSTTGNAADWADVSNRLRGSTPAGCSSSTRAVWGSVYPSPFDAIDYIDYASGGASANFGDLLGGFNYTGVGALSSSTRGCWAGGGDANSQDTICYITLASTGNALDFGDPTVARTDMIGMASATRGLFCGGEGGGSKLNTVDYITVASTGNAIDFGDLLAISVVGSGAANTVTAIYGGGTTSGAAAAVDVIQERTIASTGNFSDFGDLSQANFQLTAASSSTRVVFGGGQNSGSVLTNEIQYITIASAGNAVDFGDLLQATDSLASASAVQGNL